MSHSQSIRIRFVTQFSNGTEWTDASSHKALSDAHDAANLFCLASPGAYFRVIKRTTEEEVLPSTLY